MRKNNYKAALLMESLGFEKKSAKGFSEVNQKCGLAPWVGEAPVVLILGTLPSDISIQNQAYYQNKSRNCFWKLMHALWSNDANMKDKDFVMKHHIALWDCLHSAERIGNLDSGLGSTKEPNKIKEFLNNYPTIKTIILNGTGKTTDLFNQYFYELRKNYEVISSTSTSNANAKVFDVKLKGWEIVKLICDK